MAGGKETPRQKLIGLMYLVLLALLALQVSDAVMERFYLIDESLKGAKVENLKRNEMKLSALRKKVEELGNKEADLKTLKAAEEVNKRSAELTAFIDKLRDGMITKAAETKTVEEARDPEHGGLYKSAKEETKVAEFMEAGNGKELKKKLDDYVDYLNGLKKEFPEQFKDLTFEKLAADGKDDPIFKRNAEQKNKGFVELNFHHTPLVAALAVLSDKQVRVIDYSAQVLSKFSFGEDLITFDEVVGMFSAESRIVAAGTKYKADIFLAGRDSKLIPTITMDGKPLKVENGIGKLEFTASGGAYDPETRRVKVKKKYNISYPWKGTTKEIPGEIEYEVAEPQIEVSSGAVQALYLECANPLKIKVPALGANYNPSFTCQGGTIRKGQSIGDAIVYPTNPAGVKIGVTNDGTNLGEVSFKTRGVPNPSFEAKASGRPVDFLKGEKTNLINIVITPKADPTFAAALPDDANYEVKSITASYIVGGAVRGNRTYNSGAVRVADFQPVPGSRVFIKVEQIIRRTATGDEKEVKMPDQSRIFNVSFIE